MRLNGTRQLFEYWNELRDQRAAPKRVEIAPAALGRSLTNLFILDAGVMPVRFRLAGTWLGEVYGREWTGEPFVALFDRDDQALVSRLVEAVVEEAVIVVLDVHAAARPDRTAELELVLLPLDDNPARLVGALHTDRKEPWHGAYPLGSGRLTGVRIVDPDRPLFDLTNRPSIAIPETYGRRKPPSRTLRVIEGGASEREPELHSRPMSHLKLIEPGLDPIEPN